MIIEGNSIEKDARLEADVLIVGSGAAGMVLAKEFEGTGQKVILLEAGSEDYSSHSQDFYKGEVVGDKGHGALDAYRRRMLGGTSNVWGGRCSAFVESDFESREHVPGSGWPVSKTELDPFYARAHEHCDIGGYDYKVASSVAGEPKIVPDLESEIVLQDEMWRFSLPTSFKTKYREEIEASKNVTIILEASCLKLCKSDEQDRLSHVLVAAGKDRRFKVVAKHYVLAAGGLETTRILLNSDELGNSSDQLGRFYGSHLSGNFGDVKLTEKSESISWKYTTTKDGIYYKQQLRIADDFQKEHGLLNTRVIMTHPEFGNPRHRSGVLSGAYLVKRFFKGQIPPEYSKDLASGEYKHVMQHIGNILRDIPGSLAFGFDWFFRRTIKKRKLPSIALKSRAKIYTLHFDSEQSPCADSRITLSDERDDFGQRRLSVDWNYNESDVDKLLKTYTTIIEEIERSGAGESLATADDVKQRIIAQMGVGSHHVGSTRMSDDPGTGVVNSECQLFDSKDVFIASPSVFCTGGFANPFLTIVAFAVRIADTIKETDSKREA